MTAMIKYENIISIKGITEKLELAGRHLVLNEPFFYEFFIRCTFKKTTSIETAGVCFTSRGPEFIYNPEFIDSLNQEQVNFLVIHEILHLVSNHMARAKRSNQDLYTSNIVADMIINTTILRDFSCKTKKPSDKVYEIPKKYDGKLILEPLYGWYEENKEEDDSQQDQTGDQSQDGDSDGSEGNNSEGKGSKSSEKSFDEHIESTVDSSYQEEFVKSVVNEARLKGVLSGREEQIINTLYKSKENYLNKIKLATAGLLGTHRQGTWTRYNRRNPMLKGSKNLGNRITVILDTSGSFCYSFEKALGVIFGRDATIELIQIDTEVHDVRTITKKAQLRNLKIRGLGGSNLNAAVYLANKQFPKNPILVLTDGYIEKLDFSKTKKKVLVLSTEVAPSYTGKNVKVIVIPRD